MKKSLLALAVFGAFAGAAQAQSSITIYGLIDQGIVHSSNAAPNGDSKTALAAATQSNRIGFTGTEDLGSGMKAFFRLESQFLGDTGAIDDPTASSVLFRRAANVGLAGGFGTLTLGRQTDPFYIAYASGDTRPAYLMGSSLQPFVKAGRAANMQLLWVDNGISYTTPDLNGFKATVYYAFGEQTGDSSAGKQQGLTANYVAGPLTVNAGFVQTYSKTAGTTFGEKNGQAYTINGGYTFGPATVRASWSSFKDPIIDAKFDVYGLSALYAVSSTVDVSAGYYRLNGKNVTAAQDANLFGVEADYKLSKRTTLYAAYARSNDGQVLGALHSTGAGTAPTGAGASGAGGNEKDTQNVFAVGVRHTF